MPYRPPAGLQAAYVQASGLDPLGKVMGRFFEQQQKRQMAEQVTGSTIGLMRKYGYADQADHFAAIEDPTARAAAMAHAGPLLELVEERRLLEVQQERIEALPPFPAGDTPEAQVAWQRKAYEAGADTAWINAQRAAAAPVKPPTSKFMLDRESGTVEAVTDQQVRDNPGRYTRPPVQPQVVKQAASVGDWLEIGKMYRDENKAALGSSFTLSQTFAALDEAMRGDSPVAQQRAVMTFVSSADNTAAREGEVAAFWESMGLTENLRTQVMKAGGKANPEVIRRVYEAASAANAANQRTLQLSREKYAALGVPADKLNAITSAAEAEVANEISRSIEQRQAEGAAPGPPPMTERVVGEVYDSPKGPVRWTAEGWVPVTGAR